MRALASSAALATLLVVPSPASAQAADPSPDAAAVAVAIGAATIFAGFVVGGTLVAANLNNAAKAEAGWLTIEGGFALAPLTSHAAVGEWWRGAAFAAVPTATTLGSVPVFAATQDAVASGTITQQAIMWGCFGAGLASAVVGVIDAAFAPGRAFRVAPSLSLGSHTASLIIGGAL